MLKNKWNKLIGNMTLSDSLAPSGTEQPAVLLPWSSTFMIQMDRGLRLRNLMVQIQPSTHHSKSSCASRMYRDHLITPTFTMVIL